MTKLGKLLFTLIFIGLVVFGVSKWWNRLAPKNLPKTLRPEARQDASEVELATPRLKVSVPTLVRPGRRCTITSPR